MDMVLYSLIKKEIDNAPLSKVESVDGNKIEFVDVLPSNLEKNTLYFVLGEYNGKDKINVGGRGIQCIVYNGEYIDYGILNNNRFFSGYDFNRGYERVLRTSTDGTYITVDNTVAETINYFMIKGQTKVNENGEVISGDSFLKTISVSEDGTVNDIPPEYYININKYFNALPNGMADTLDMTTGVYTQVLETASINGDLAWQHIYPYGEYREFKVKSFINNKPSYLLSNSLYNSTELMEINENNAFTINSIFTVASPSTCANKNCIYTNNGALLIRIHNDLIKNGTTYVSGLQNYLKDNPIVFSVGRLVPKEETILAVANNLPLMAIEGQTTIGVQSDTSHPLIEIELPVYKNAIPSQSTSIFGLRRSVVNEEEVIDGTNEEIVEKTTNEEEIAEEPTIMSLNLNEELEALVEIVEPTEEVVYEYETVVLDGNLNWQNSAPLGDCREFKCIGFDEKPIYLTEDGLYDEIVFMPFNEENVTVLDVDSDFTINSKAEPHGECIFVHNNVLYIHICSTSVRTGKGMTYAKSLKQYLTDNPITLKIRKI